MKVIAKNMMSWIWVFVVMITLTQLLRATPHYRGPTSDHFDGKKFFNPSGGSPKSFWQLLNWQLGGHRAKWPDWVENNTTPHITNPHAKKDELVVTFINHATVLLQIDSVNILTDPVWSKRVSPFTWIGPSRHRAPGIDFDKLPPIDIVLISHNHYDHLDINTLKQLDEKFHPIFFVALGDAEILRTKGIRHITEMDWWQETSLSDNAKVTFVPCKHWSGRSFNDRFHSLWGGFYIQWNQHSAYYSGDTGYSYHFKEIREKLGAPDFSLLPIGAYEPRWFMKDHHMNPEEAVLAHRDLRSKRSMGVHFGTFQLTDEAIDDPLKALQEARKTYQISEDQFFTLKEGETRYLNLKH